MKRCTKCGERKARTNFHSDKTRVDGLCLQCKDCKRAYSRAWSARNVDRKRAASKEWYEANRAHANAAAAEWSRAHPGKHREYDRKWRAANPERVLVSRRLGVRARRRKGPAVCYALVLLRDPCSYCGGPMDEIDHIVPVSKNGSSDWDNLTAACRDCNAEKRDKPLLGFLLA